MGEGWVRRGWAFMACKWSRSFEPRFCSASRTQAGCSCSGAGRGALNALSRGEASSNAPSCTGVSSGLGSSGLGSSMAASKGSPCSTSATRLRLADAKAVNSSPCSSAFFAAMRAVGLNSSTLSTRGSALTSLGLYTVAGSSSCSGAGGSRLRLINLRGRGSSTYSGT